MLPFSRRYHNELVEKQTLKVCLPAILRGRLIRWLQNHNDQTTDGFGNWSDLITEATKSLLDYYGQKNLTVKDIVSKKVLQVEWQGFLLETTAVQDNPVTG